MQINKSRKHWSVNEAAADIIEQKLIPNKERLNIEIFVLKNGATVIDMGILCKGGFLAGKLFTEIELGGLGKMNYTMVKLDHFHVPGLQVISDDPAVAEMASHVAATKVPWQGDIQVVSGPVRSIVGSDVFAQSVEYRDPDPRKAVAGVQTEKMPDEELTDNIGKICGISPDRLYIMAARTGCMVGAVQVCSRNVEQSMPTVCDRGFDMDQIIEGNAVSPLLGIVNDEAEAGGRVNDCLNYGQETNLTVRCEDEDIKAMLDDIPFSKNKDIYGTPFKELLERCHNNWANVPRDWDAPCRINFFNVVSGNRFSTGMINRKVLEDDFMGKGGMV